MLRYRPEQGPTAQLSGRTATVPTDELNESFMRVALEEAARAPAIGEVPIAAVVVREGKILSQAHNYRELWQDPTAHAEVIAIRAAATALGTWRLTETTLYVTVEPCTMCLGAIILARIPRVVFGATDPKAGACGSVFDLSSEPKLNHRVTVTGGVLEQECQALIQKFFKELREASSATKPHSTQ
ncbi:MAG: tRNA adenosine(34) deaminase TadA [Nitrospirota bacterium]|nr:tRNA adenosine(34) deaminase TadA [Nitrospirota bacterium]